MRYFDLPSPEEAGVPVGDYGQIMNGDGYIPFKCQSKFVLSVDLGQAVDPTALCVIEKIVEAAVPREIGSDLFEKAAPPRYEVRHLERMPLQTSYPAVINRVGNLLASGALKGKCELVIDFTGIGRPVFDMFVTAGMSPIGITITSGDRATDHPDGSGFRVAKILLVSRLQAMLHAGELRIAKSLPEAATLASELQDFRANISDSGYVGFGARIGKHDDLVLALAIGCWYLVGGGGGAYSVEPFPI